MGVVSPNGIGVDAFARALAAGESGISNIDHIKADGLKSWAAGQVRDFDAAKVIDPAEARRESRGGAKASGGSGGAAGVGGGHFYFCGFVGQREIGGWPGERGG